MGKKVAAIKMMARAWKAHHHLVTRTKSTKTRTCKAAWIPICSLLSRSSIAGLTESSKMKTGRT